MAGDSRLRIGGWVLGSRGGSGDRPGPAGGAVGLAGPDDDRLGYTGATVEPALDPEAAGYEGRHRQGEGSRPAARLRAVSIAAVGVGVLLLGTGLLARLFGPESSPHATPSTPSRTVAASPSAQLGGLGARTPVPTSSLPASPDARGPQTVAHEAEDAELGNHAQAVSLAGASGDQAVRLSGAQGGRFVLFTTVAPARGRYDVTVFYVTEQAKAGELSVNGEPPIGVTFEPGGEPGTPDAVTVSIQLVAGENTVSVGSTGGAPMFLDRITVTG